MKIEKKIRLFIDAHVFDGIPQGTVTYVSGLYSELVKDGRFQLFVGSNDIEIAKKYLFSDNFIHIKYNTHSKFKRLLITIPRILKVYKIDIAHFQYISPISKSCKYIVTIHDLLFMDFPNSFPLTYRIKNLALFYLTGKWADLVTTVSEYSRQSIHKHFSIPLSDIILTPNAISLSEEGAEQVKELIDKDFILYVSRIEPRKNQGLLLRIWSELELHRRKMLLVFVGAEGIYDKDFINALEHLNIEQKNNVLWLKRVPEKQLIWLYKNCSLFVYPSLAEGFGIPPIEAAYHGSKVLCSNKTAMKDFIFFNEFLFSPDSETEFKNKLEWALNNPFPHEFVINSIKSKYNWKVIANSFANEIIKLNDER